MAEKLDKVSPSILWIDDQPFVVEWLASIIKRNLDVSIDFASTIKSAQNSLKLKEYQLVITDLLLEDYGASLPLLKDVRKGHLSGKQGPKIPIIICSVGARDDLTRSAIVSMLENENVRFVSKDSFVDQPDTFVALIRDVLSKE